MNLSKSKNRFYFQRRILIFILLASIFRNSVLAQTFTLDQILTKIEENNPSILSYQNKINAADELANGANAWAAPKLSTEWDDVPYQFDYKKSQLRIALMQDLPNPKKINAKENFLRSLSSIDKNDKDYRKNELFAQAKEAYYTRYITEKKINVLEESIKIIDLMISLAEKQMAITKGELATIYRLKARKIENETMLIHEKNMVRSQIVILNYLMNADINQEFTIDTINLMKNYRSLRADMKLDSIDCKRSDILKMTSQINAMKLNQAFIATRNKPDFGLRFEHYAKLGGRPDAFAIQGTMTIPIVPWSSKGYKSEIKSMNFSITAMEQNKQNMINMATQMIKMYLIELESEYKELDNYSKVIIPTYKKGLDANLLSYGQNTNDLNMTLMAWDDLQMAKIEYLKHLDIYFKIQTEYEKEMQIR